MASSSTDPAEVPEAPLLTTASISNAPSFVKFPLVVIMSLGLSTLLYTLAANYAGFELAAVSRDATSEVYIAGFLAWKIVGLAVGWCAGYDYKDIASLACLGNLPYYFLLYTFYQIDMSAAAAALIIDVAATTIPFALTRPLIHAHADDTVKDANQEVAQDITNWALLALFGSTVYAIVIYASLQSWLPVYIVTHFDGVRSMQAAHDAKIPALVATLVPVGLATAQFLFTPAVGSRGNPGLTDPQFSTVKAVRFEAEEASLAETLAWNLGFGAEGLSKRAEILAKRTGVLIAASVVNTFVRTVMTVEGTQMVGTLGWSLVWGVAAGVTGLAYGWTANE